MTVLLPERLTTTPARELWGRLGEEYDVDSSCERAQKKRDPLLAPHGCFRNLAPGNNHQALEFVQRFGPLENNDWRVGQEDKFPAELKVKTGGDILRTVRIDLSDFWDKQITFQVISRIYEGRDDLEKLDAAWKDLERHWGRTGLLARFVGEKRLPRNWHELPPPPLITGFWSEKPAGKKEHAIAMAYFAVTHFLRDLGPRWTLEGERLRIRMEPRSLWEMIWNFFANDTASGAWKFCAVCARIFYPKRKDADCCTTRHQSLWSKREYARRLRAAQKSDSQKRNSEARDRRS